MNKHRHGDVCASLLAATGLGLFMLRHRVGRGVISLIAGG